MQLINLISRRLFYDRYMDISLHQIGVRNISSTIMLSGQNDTHSLLNLMFGVQ